MVTENKREDVANYIQKEVYLQMSREKWLNWLYSSLGGLAYILGTYFKDMSKRLLPQFKVREF